ncbi:MAG: peptidase MA family metallohydrolase [Candidatus Auribacterota bacterium]|jgi:tetratricopeptide (TPR) repeat protein|nr:peptidase MA family metallohydrolase [Candidatus Auribacterota bacterium]
MTRLPALLFTGTLFLLHCGVVVNAFLYDTDADNDNSAIMTYDNDSTPAEKSEKHLTDNDVALYPDQETIRKLNDNFSRITAYLEANDYRRAILLIKESELLDPYNNEITGLLVRVLNNYAVDLAKNKQFEKAIDTMEQAYIIDQSEAIKANYIQILKNSVYFNMDQKNWKTAIEVASYIRELTDDSSESLILYSSIFAEKGLFLLGGGKINDAKESFFQALDFYPYSKDALFYLGHIAYQQQQLDQAKEYWDKLAMFDSDPAVAQLREKLARELEAEQGLSSKELSHFDIHYDSSISDKLFRNIKAILENAYSDIGARFSFYPKNKITVLFLEHETFQASTHLPHFVRGVYDGKIRIPILGRETSELLKEIIYHEYVHVVIEQLGNGKVPRWFNEGLAVRFSQDTVKFEVLKGHVMNNTCISFDNLDSALIQSGDFHTVILAYEQSATLVEFILYKYSMNHVRDMIKKFKEGESFESILKSVFHTDLKDFEKKWKRYVRQRMLSNTERKKLRYILKSADE